MTVGDRIREFREAKNLTQEALGTLCGTTKQTIFKYENGVITNIPLDRIERIADAVGVSAARLLGWEYDEKSTAEKNLAIMESYSEYQTSGRSDACEAMLRTFGSEYSIDLTRNIGDKTALLYYHAFGEEHLCFTVSNLMTLIEKMPADEAERIYMLVLAYTKADERTRQMVGLALDQFVPDKLRDRVASLVPYHNSAPMPEDMPDAETIALARQILEDKRAKEASVASSGEDGNRKMA